MVRFLRGKNSFLLSSNVNEVIREVLNILFFYEKISQSQKKDAHNQTKIKKAAFYAHKKHLRGKKSIIRLFTILCFLCFCLVASLCFSCFLCVWDLFVKEIKSLIYITTDIWYGMPAREQYRKDWKREPITGSLLSK